MSEERKFSAGQLLGEGIRRLGREELISLALEICADAADCGAEYHGNIHPGNISRGEGGAALGPRADHAPGEWSTDELEYMAPELFWNGTATAAADVYSIGLLLFAGVTGGLLPFFKRAPENMTNEMRASALRRRMNGDRINIPAAAGEKLGPVMAKCLNFDETERYADTRELAEALRPCVGEGDAKAMEMFGKPERELSEVERMMAGILARLDTGEEEPEKPEAPASAEPPAPPEPPVEPEPPAEEPKRRRPKVELPPVPPVEPPKPKGPRPEYKVDRDFEERAIREREAKPKRNRKPVLIVLAICAVVVIVALAFSIFVPGDGAGEPSAPPESSAPETENAVLPSSAPSAEPTPTPTPTPTPSPTPEPESTYEVFMADCSWEQAKALCEEKGGHLAVISDAEELAKVTELAEEAGATFVWIGLRRVDGELSWVTGESVDYYAWGPGEPSVRDTDSTAEDYVLLWHTSTGWIYNDLRNDPVSAYPGAYSGKTAYVCEYEPE